MAATSRWLKFVLGGAVAVALVYLEILAGSRTGVCDTGAPGVRQLAGDATTETTSRQGTSSSSPGQEAALTSTGSVADDAPTTTTTTTTASSSNHTVDKNTLRYMHRPGFVIENSGLCRGNGSSLRVLILVTSAPDHERHRMAIRFTWGHFSQRKDVAIGFFLGAVEDEARQKAIREESEQYGDVVQSLDVDGYRRLSLKTLSMLAWVDAHCPDARFVLKTDDDMFVNVPELLVFVREHEDARNTMFGLLARGWRPVRAPDNKYHVSRDELPEPVLPDFLTGPAYLMTNDVVRRLHDAALDRRFVPLEDVLFTGLVARDLGVAKVHSPKFQPGLRSSSADDCKRHAAISLHDVGYEQQFHLWSQLLDGKLKC